MSLMPHYFQMTLYKKGLKRGGQRSTTKYRKINILPAPRRKTDKVRPHLTQLMQQSIIGKTKAVWAVIIRISFIPD